MQHDTIWMWLLDLGWVVCRHNISPDFIAIDTCPALWRSLWRGEGIWHSSWPGILDSGKDYYYQLAAYGFKDDNLRYIWQFAAHCSDWGCQYAWISYRVFVDGTI